MSRYYTTLWNRVKLIKPSPPPSKRKKEHVSKTKRLNINWILFSQDQLQIETCGSFLLSSILICKGSPTGVRGSPFKGNFSILLIHIMWAGERVGNSEFTAKGPFPTVPLIEF